MFSRPVFLSVHDVIMRVVFVFFVHITHCLMIPCHIENTLESVEINSCFVFQKEILNLVSYELFATLQDKP